MACAAGGNAGSGEAALAALEPDRAGPRVTGHQTGTGQDGSAAPPLLVVLLMLSRHSAVVARKSGAHVVLPWLSVARVSGSWLFSVTSLLAQWSPVALPSSDWLPSGAAWSLAEHMWAHAPQNWGELLQIFPSASVLAAAVGPLRNWAGADATQMTWTGRALFLPLPKLGEVCGNGQASASAGAPFIESRPATADSFATKLCSVPILSAEPTAAWPSPTPEIPPPSSRQWPGRAARRRTVRSMALSGGPKLTTGPTLFGLPMKQASLLTLTFQNSALILILHYSRVMRPPGDHRYFASTAVLLNEVLKLAISLTFAIYDASRSLAPQTPATVLFEQLFHSVFSGDSWKLAIPAVLYTFENTLQYVALGNLEVVHFQVLSQLKILTTALFMVLLLGRSLGIRRWLSLIFLTLGISIVTLSSSSNSRNLSFEIFDLSDHFFPRSVHELGQIADDTVVPAPGDLSSPLTRRSATYEGILEDQELVPRMNYSLGVTAVLVAAIVSGLTGVYFEKLLKEPTKTVSIWTRNVQLAFYSLFPALIVGVIITDGKEISKHGFFDGYNWVVWTAIVLQAVGGLLTSLCINYADNIAKNFATSISIVIGFIASVGVFGFLFGTALVITSTYAYALPERKRSRPPPIHIATYEKTTIVEGGGTPRIRYYPYQLDFQPEWDKLSVEAPVDSALSAVSSSMGMAMASSTSRPASPLTFLGRSPTVRRGMEHHKGRSEPCESHYGLHSHAYEV
ncbi:uncharacterized protein CTHT_0064450 [Thermochaetoides thermophila DSM 1495]|uniref:UDP-galactose transporter-like protein n=1 Tax=Chaetomium thermophilum (strain DSM 1495 / CBS 144.50 / IMI 039719) TaxID=759272 RepID=G0SEP2_CHATD|nr:hypothetical protein CTHT_0064450 [Thermochaetoides thermophila DSM 1495]EGS18419.1 hypothetical protein CTHT_0064450 [Thermochaetoides thermophila DSM 1495]